MVLRILGIVIFAMGLYSFMLTVSNVLTLRKLKPRTLLTDGPLVTICIPARNEESNIGRCLESMTKQNYRNIEILALDDSSEDRTAEIIKQYEQKDPRVHYIKGLPLPSGWKGKLYGMHQMLQRSNGEFLLFTDADTIHTPDSVAFGLTLLENRKADYLSGYPTEDIPGYWTELTVSAMVFSTSLMVPLLIQQKLQLSFFALSIGQYLFMRKEALLACGGFEPIKNQIADDVSLTRQMVKHHKKTLFADLKHVLTCQMYTDFGDAIRGLSRSLLGVIPRSLIPLIVVAVSILIPCALALPISAVMMLTMGFQAEAILMLAGGALLWAGWFIGCRFHGFSLKAAISQPITFLIIIYLYWRGVFMRKANKRVIWKGREV